MDFMEIVRERARAKCPTIVFADADAETVTMAAKKAMDYGMIKPVLVGSKEKIESLGIDLTGMKIIDVASEGEKVKEFAKKYEARGDLPAEAVEPIIAEPVGFSCMMVAEGEADGFFGGFLYPTQDIINCANLFIGLSEGTLTPSSYVVVDVPGWQGGENGYTVFADCTLVPQPSSEELASIAINTATSVNKMLGWEPRVAMISFSTKGSAMHDDVLKVVKATEIVRQKQPNLLIDGELQVDAAIVPKVSMKKIKGDNPLKGTANILIFPDLDCGNSASKLCQIYAGAHIYGAVICGFAKPIVEVSRSFGVDDLVGAIGMLAGQA
jgi:phosphate acetyltransferase